MALDNEDLLDDQETGDEGANDQEPGGEGTGGEGTNTPEGDSSYVSPIEDEWELWEKLLDLGSESAFDAREYAIEQSIEAFLSGMEEDPAYQKDATVEGVVTPLVVSRTSSLECEIKAPPGTNLHIGDMVGCFDEDWLVVDLYADKIGIINGKMWICNDIINFQNHSPTVYVRHCVVDDGSYSKRSTDPDAFIPTNTYKIYISLEFASQQLFIDKRLGLGPIYDPHGDLILEVYKIIGIDIKSKNRGEGSHLMVLTVQRDVYNPSTDSLEYNLCDVYHTMGDESSDPVVTGSSYISGRDTIRLGTSRIYVGSFADAEEADSGDGIYSTKEWTVKIEGVAMDSTWYEISSSHEQYPNEHNVLKITMPLNEDLVGQEITLKLSGAEGAYGEYEKKVRVVTVG